MGGTDLPDQRCLRGRDEQIASRATSSGFYHPHSSSSCVPSKLSSGQHKNCEYILHLVHTLRIPFPWRLVSSVLILGLFPYQAGARQSCIDSPSLFIFFFWTRQKIWSGL